MMLINSLLASTCRQRLWNCLISRHQAWISGGGGGRFSFSFQMFWSCNLADLSSHFCHPTWQNSTGERFEADEQADVQMLVILCDSFVAMWLYPAAVFAQHLPGLQLVLHTGNRQYSCVTTSATRWKWLLARSSSKHNPAGYLLCETPGTFCEIIGHLESSQQQINSKLSGCEFTHIISSIDLSWSIQYTIAPQMHKSTQSDVLCGCRPKAEVVTVYSALKLWVKVMRVWLGPVSLTSLCPTFL